MGGRCKGPLTRHSLGSAHGTHRLRGSSGARPECSGQPLEGGGPAWEQIVPLCAQGHNKTQLGNESHRKELNPWLKHIWFLTARTPEHSAQFLPIPKASLKAQASAAPPPRPWLGSSVPPGALWVPGPWSLLFTSSPPPSGWGPITSVL